MKISTYDEQQHTLEVAVTLTAGEVELLAAGAWGRLARVLKVDAGEVRQRAEQMLTEQEVAVFLQESVMRKAAEQAFEALDMPFMLTPEVFALEDLREGQALEFRAKAHRVPDMKIDLKTKAEPFAPAGASAQNAPSPKDGEEGQAAVPTAYERKRARRLLKARLNGTVPEPLAKAAMKLREEEFHRELRAQGLTYREWRIENNMKPQDVDAMIYEETVNQLFEDIALDLAFFRNGLEISPEEQAAVLAEIAPGRENALFEDLADAGRLCLLKQKARRSIAEQWAIENLLF